jgi:hypothetical protein
LVRPIDRPPVPVLGHTAGAKNDGDRLGIDGRRPLEDHECFDDSRLGWQLDGESEEQAAVVA